MLKSNSLLKPQQGKYDSLWVCLAKDSNGAYKTDKHGRTLLHWACVFDGHYVDSIKALLEKGMININQKDSRGDTPFYLACCHKRNDIAKLLLTREELDVNKKTKFRALFTYQYNLLEIVFDNNLIDVFQCLLKHPKFNFMSQCGHHVFIQACLNNKMEYIKLLLSHPALKVDEIDPSTGHSALHLAFDRGLDSMEIVELLLKNGANINLRNRDGETPLTIAVTKNSMELVKFLLENDADINLRNRDGETPLTIAAAKNFMEIVKFLLENDAKINLRNRDGDTPLSIAVTKNSMELVKFPLENDAYIDFLRNRNGETPLNIAVMNNHIEITRLLIEKMYEIEEEKEIRLFEEITVKGCKTCLFDLAKGHDGIIKIFDEIRNQKAKSARSVVAINNFGKGEKSNVSGNNSRYGFLPQHPVSESDSKAKKEEQQSLPEEDVTYLIFNLKLD